MLFIYATVFPPSQDWLKSISSKIKDLSGVKKVIVHVFPKFQSQSFYPEGSNGCGILCVSISAQLIMNKFIDSMVRFPIGQVDYIRKIVSDNLVHNLTHKNLDLAERHLKLDSLLPTLLPTLHRN